MTAIGELRGRTRPRRAGAVIPLVLALVAVAVQITYPLVQGSARDAVTVLVVLSSSGAVLSHAWIHRGVRTAVAVALVFVGGGLLVELVGVATGFPFGAYAYADRLGPMVGEVPLVIPLAWSMLGYPALVVARLITPSRWLGTCVGAVALAAWDLFLDPQMVAEGYWTWHGAGPHLIGTVPASNYLAWLGTAWLMMMALWHLTAGWSTRPADARVPVGLYLWTWAGSSLAHLAFLDLPQSGAYGGIGMGLVVALLAWRTGRATAPATGAPRTEVVDEVDAGGPPAPRRGEAAL